MDRQNKELSSAMALSADAHMEQSDLAGTPYFLHCIRVAMRLDDTVQKTVAFLHDVVEDTKIGFDDLEELGFHEDVVNAVNAITKRQGEDYIDYVNKVAENEIARAVKLSDLLDNMDTTRLPVFDKYESKRLKKYHSCYKYLKSL